MGDSRQPAWGCGRMGIQGVCPGCHLLSLYQREHHTAHQPTAGRGGHHRLRLCPGERRECRGGTRGYGGRKGLLHPSEPAVPAIVEAYAKREPVQFFTALVPIEDIEKNDYNLSVSSYVEQEDKREKVDIDAINAELVDVVAKVNELRSQVDEIIRI